MVIPNYAGRLSLARPLLYWYWSLLLQIPAFTEDHIQAHGTEKLLDS